MPLVPNPTNNEIMDELLDVLGQKNEFALKYERYAEHLFSKSIEEDDDDECLPPNELSDVEQMGNCVLFLKTLRELIQLMQAILSIVARCAHNPLKGALPELPPLRDSMAQCYRLVAELNRIQKEGELRELGKGFETEAEQAIEMAAVVNRIGIKFDSMCVELKRQCKRRKRQRQKQNAKKP